MEKEVQDVLDALERHLPPVFARSEVGRLTGGLVSPKLLSDLDCKGEGPRGRVQIRGRRVGYQRKDFLPWLAAQMKSLDVGV